MINIHYCLNTAIDNGERRRPEIVINESGIIYKKWEGNSLFDIIILHDCCNIPNNLPSQFKIKEVQRRDEIIIQTTDLIRAVDILKLDNVSITHKRKFKVLYLTEAEQEQLSSAGITWQAIDEK